MTVNRFEPQKQFIDDISDLTTHLLNSIASSGEKTIASMILLLSCIPEYYGLMGSGVNVPVAIAMSGISLWAIKLALREKPHKATLPFVGTKVSIRYFALLHAALMLSEMAIIIHSRMYIDVALVVASIVGAVCSERIATVIKAEMAERSKLDTKAEKERFKLKGWKEAEAIRQATAKAKLNAKLADVDPTIQGATTAPRDAQHAPNVEHDAVVALTEKQRREGQQHSQQTRQTAAQKRQAEVFNILTTKFSGVDVDSLNKSEIGRMLDVSPTTISRDIHVLRERGMLNGTAPRRTS